MGIKYYGYVDLTTNELRNFVVQPLAADPGTGKVGQEYYNTTTSKLRVCTNATGPVWADVAGAAGGDVSSNTATSVDSEVALFNATTGKSIKRSALTATVVKSASGILSAAAIGTDYSGPTSALATGILKSTTATGALSIATASTDYLVPGDITGKANLASPTFTGTVTLPATGAGASEAATRSYVDAARNGIAVKDPVRAASTANVTVASALVNTLVMDGVTLATGDRVLLRNQTTASENGIYVVVASGAASRATDVDTAAELVPGSAMWVNEGTTQGDTRFVLTTNAPITLGTTNLTFTQDFSASSVNAGAGLTATGNILAVGTGTGITVNADDVAINTAVVGRQAGGTIAGQNGALTSFVITHGYTLANKYLQEIAVWDTTTNEKVYPTITATSTTTTTLDFGTFAPVASQMSWFGVFGA